MCLFKDFSDDIILSYTLPTKRNRNRLVRLTSIYKGSIIQEAGYDTNFDYALYMRNDSANNFYSMVQIAYTNFPNKEIITQLDLEKYTTNDSRYILDNLINILNSR
jgi:hypothetical protein